jgi:hypothetical protein
MQLHHAIPLPLLVEAWILDRIPVSPTGDRDRPSVRFFRDRLMAAGIALPAGGRGSTDADEVATLSFDRSWLASVTPLVSVRENRADLREDEVELRARTDLTRMRDRVGLVHLSDEAIDGCLAAWSGGHPEDDGTGRLTEAARRVLADLYADPRRIPPDPSLEPLSY